MKPYFKIIKIFAIVVSYSTALLFIYAATSKFLDFENFQVQLGQSPLLSAFAVPISIAVPVIEIFLAIGLTLSRYRLLALKGSLFLMVIFTTYIYVILNYSAYVPCSCGGVLEKMTWNQHLVFNFIFLISLIFALIFNSNQAGKNEKLSFIKAVLIQLFIICGIIAFGIGIVLMLFQWSEQEIQYNNTLTRRMPPHAAQKEKQYDLKINSYYFAGSFEGKIYLGNNTAPLLVTEIDTAFHTIKTHKIIPNDKTLPFQSPMIRVLKNHFFLFEGNVPYIFTGNTLDWNAMLMVTDGSPFSYLEPINKNKVAVRFIQRPSGHSILGTIDIHSGEEHKSNTLLEQQFDGIFDVDGSLHYDTKTHRIVYVYRYRNQFIVANEQLALEYSGKTIDTISKAQIELTEVKSKSITTFSTPPLIVNKSSAVYDDLLFVNSLIPGKYESRALWKNASFIDVYDLKDHSYQASFPIYDIDNYKMRSFMIEDNKIYVLINNQIVSYRLLSHLLAKTNYYEKGS